MLNLWSSELLMVQLKKIVPWENPNLTENGIMGGG